MDTLHGSHPGDYPRAWHSLLEGTEQERAQVPLSAPMVAGGVLKGDI